ncbi:MAG: FkbM family methyltransferase [Anaerolineae bacterium]
MAYHQETDIQLLTEMFRHLTNRLVIDIGAEKGTVVQVFLEQGCEKVYAFEPFPPSLAGLRERYGSEPRVEIFDHAAGSQNEQRDLHIAQDDAGNDYSYYHSLVLNTETPVVHWGRAIPVQVRTLDSLVAEGKLPARVGVLKIDTEGNDLNVLQGMGQLQSDIVVVECWTGLDGTLEDPPYTLAELAATMRPRGYNHFGYLKRNQADESLTIDTTHTQPGDWGNVIFIHDSQAALLLPPMRQMQQRLTQQIHQRLQQQRWAHVRHNLRHLLERIGVLPSR